MAAVSDAVTALEEATTCVEAAMRALKGARLSGECGVTQDGIRTVLESVAPRLAALRAEVETDGC
jgi:hypothetical protein